MKKIATIVTGLCLAACSSIPMVDVPSANQNTRINHLVIHFTSEDFAESLRLLSQKTERPVSVHYLVPEPGDPTYGNRRLRVYRLVEEDRRAWHAGTSYWAGADVLNDTSIGIEIVNQSRCVNKDPDAEQPTPENQECTFLDFPEEQLELVVRLVKDIAARNPDIDPVDVIGHADIAPGRRVDPGPKFPWKRLYDEGVGAWYDDDTVLKYRQRFKSGVPSAFEVQEALARYGYAVERTGELDAQTRFVLRTFQMHFRPSNYSGWIDAETAAILYALNEKYRPEDDE
jgi:N-acetyl-anhydromuramyl-L-alanine amidase AmpD